MISGEDKPEMKKDNEADLVNALVSIISEFFNNEGELVSLVNKIWYENGSLKPQRAISAVSREIEVMLPDMAEASFSTRKKEFVVKFEADINDVPIEFQVIISSRAEKISIQVDKSLREALLNENTATWQIAALICAAASKGLIRALGLQPEDTNTGISFGKTKFDTVVDFETALTRQSLACIINGVPSMFNTSTFKESLRSCPRFTTEHTNKVDIDNAINEYLRKGLVSVVDNIVEVCQRDHFKEYQALLNSNQDTIGAILTNLQEQVAKIRVFEYRARGSINNETENGKAQRAAKGPVAPGKDAQGRPTAFGEGNKKAADSSTNNNPENTKPKPNDQK